MKIAILALQGAFIEHEKVLSSLGISSFEIRQKKDLEQNFDGLILPGGESTVQGKLLREEGLKKPLQRIIQEGIPVLGTCAGLILLAQNISPDNTSYLGTLPVTVKRNAYGRQLGSFVTDGEVTNVGNIPMTFIRAPYIKEVKENVDILAQVRNRIVAVQYQNQLGISFHPELNENTALHKYFLSLCSKPK